MIHNLAVLPLVLAGFGAASLAFTGYGYVPSPLSKHIAWGVLLNILAPSLGGFVAYALLARVAQRLAPPGLGFRDHLARTAAWYALVATALYVIVSNRNNPDFGLFGQIVIWPLWAVGTALGIDLLLSWRAAKRVGRNAAG